MVCYARIAEPKLLKLSGLVEAKKNKKKPPQTTKTKKEEAG